MPNISDQLPQASAPVATFRWADLASRIFSFPVMCMFLLAAVIFGYSGSRGVADSDIWWHLLDARYLFQQHSMLRVDLYSFTAAGTPWVNFEWLSEIPFLLSYKALGLRGVVALYSLVLTLTFIGVYYRTYRAGANYKNAALATLGAICLAGVSIAPRMLLFGWLCMVLLLLVLDHFQRTGRGLWLLPPLFGLWINLHGSWVFGIIVLCLTICSGIFEGEWGHVVMLRWNPRQLKGLLLTLAVSVAALFLNPSGYKLVLYPFDVIFRQQHAVNVVEEWQPVNFSTFNGKLALIAVFSCLTAILFSRRRWKSNDILLLAFALAVGLLHLRFLFLVGLIAAPILGPSLNVFPPYERHLDKPWLNAAIMTVVAVATFLCFPTSAALQRGVDRKFPTAALDFMQRSRITGRIFNHYEQGGYVEWEDPELRVFLDGRTDVFVYKGVFDDYLSALWIKEPFEVLNKYGINYVLIQPNIPLAYLLEHSPAWRLIYSDDAAVLFQRATPILSSTATPQTH